MMPPGPGKPASVTCQRGLYCEGIGDMKRRPISTFSLSFIDAILCGFGAAVLLFLTVNANSLAERNERTEALRDAVMHLQDQLLQARKNLLILNNTLRETDNDLERAEGLAEQIIDHVSTRRLQLAELEADTVTTKADLERLKADLQSREEGMKRLEAGAVTPETGGDRLREFQGEGDRQYLTDLKMGGERILVLVDTSASMLGKSIVEVLRRRNQSDDTKARAPKWRRAVSTADWLLTHLPPSSRFQIYGFNESAAPIVPNTDGQWLEASRPEQLNAAVDRLRRVAPQKGTSLHQAFAAVNAMEPRPDNIFLLTDGLPTQGQSRGMRTTVSAEKRLQHFASAVKVLPAGISVNIILFPMEGDPAAASAYWKLAVATEGAFFSPSVDWP